ncbi:MAG: metallophosphoesterase family protein [Bacteroidota bacterium]
MKLGIISDIHDHVPQLKSALGFLRKQTETLFCLGDLCSPFILALMAKIYSHPIHLVIGNNDADLYRMMSIVHTQAHTHVHIHGESAHLVLEEMAFSPFQVGASKQEEDTFKVGLTHFPDTALNMFHSGFYQLVCYGHNHERHHPYHQPPLLVNPGTLMGYQPARDLPIRPTFCILDTTTYAVQPYELVPDSSDPTIFSVNMI